MNVCVCVKFWSPTYNIKTRYPIDRKFWLYIASHRNSVMPYFPFLNFQNCAQEKFLKLIFPHWINIESFSNLYYTFDICLTSMILSFRARQHQRTLAPVMIFYDYDGQWYPGMDGVYVFPTFVLKIRKSRKNLNQENLPDRESNPGPL